MISVVALAVNLLFLVALLSMLQATLTLPGIAAIALTLGMAIDANVLINERVREELRNGNTPQAAIAAGYDRAWNTILDSNVTTLIAGVALFAFGSGPVKGFAVVHCLGILTSMFSAVMVSRAIVNLIYGASAAARESLDRPGVASLLPEALILVTARLGTRDGILQDQARHPVHAPRADLQRDLGRHVPDRGRRARRCADCISASISPAAR